MRFKAVLMLAAFVLISGCGNKSMDGDGDGVPDSKDKCPNSPPGCQVDANGCEQPGETAQQPETKSGEAIQPPPAPVDTPIPQVTGDTVTTPSGLKYIDMKVGDGELPQAGDLVQAHYTGWLTDGKKFDSSRDRGQAFMFPLGMGRVIKGWDEGIASMKVGGRRLLIIPSTLGYGATGAAGVIPPNATLVFDVELLGVQKPASGQ